ncbi:MAG TPA: tail fiber protein [Pyrinomonadaceae bacterium]|nr:tail fiber protein [Pyrinomonadaceae bacterium]
MDPFVAEIRIFPFNFAPKGWAFCDGQILPLSQNTALFSLLGTTYGGDGKSTFALPNLQGNAPIHAGQGPGLSLYVLGETGGSEYVTLLDSEMPTHTHVLRCQSQDPADQPAPSPARTFAPSQNATAYGPSGGTPKVQMAFQALSIAGGSQPHNNMMQYLTLNFCIALQGVYPPRT